MITSDGRGLLIDWDFSRPIDHKDARCFERTVCITGSFHDSQGLLILIILGQGTWQFVSGAILQDPMRKIHEYSDDLESFLHTVTYVLLRYSESTLQGFTLANYLQNVYDTTDVEKKEDGTIYFKGGDRKAVSLALDNYIDKNLRFVGRPGLDEGLSDIANMFSTIYKAHSRARGMDSEKVKLHHEECATRLNKYEGGFGQNMYDKLQELIDLSGKWTDAPATVVFTPVIISEDPNRKDGNVREKVGEMTRQKELFHNSALLTGVSPIQNNERLAKENPVASKKKRLNWHDPFINQ